MSVLNKFINYMKSHGYCDENDEDESEDPETEEDETQADHKS